MILFTVFDPATRAVLSHKSVSHSDMVGYSIPNGAAALVGRHIPFDEPVPSGYEIIVPADPDLHLCCPRPPLRRRSSTDRPTTCHVDERGRF